MQDTLISLRQHIVTLIKKRPVLARVEVSRPRLRLGIGPTAWTIDPSLVNASSVVYCFGVGEDIDLDRGLVKRFGCTVNAFDPTPKSIQWFKTQNAPQQIVLHEYGIGTHDGTIEFSAPRNPAHVSHTVLQGVMDDEHRISAPVKRLSTIMTELGHTRIDFLKMDIEGAEYDVVEDIVASKIFPAQVLIEYHHRFPTVGNAKTSASIDLLRSVGYKVFSVSPTGEEISFVRA